MSVSRAMPGPVTVDVTPAAMRWHHLRFAVHVLRAGERLELDTRARETAVVPLAGAGHVTAGDDAYELERAGVFETPVAGLVYVPPGPRAALYASSDWTVALGSAPATGRYPARLVAPDSITVELRGGGPARRQVNHLLAAPAPAERLIVYEVFVPGGSWAGWPPHCHDGSHGSPYLEETYFFDFDRPDGFGFHRNYLADGSYDETFAVQRHDCVAVPRGFHVTGAAPGHNMWILNFLAGELIGDARATPPYFDPATTWIAQRWERSAVELPVRAPGAAA
jgi:5-deoxy-glucuronate isomerase